MDSLVVLVLVPFGALLMIRYVGSHCTVERALRWRAGGAPFCVTRLYESGHREADEPLSRSNV